MCGVLDAFLLLELRRGRLRVALSDALKRDVLAPGGAHAAVHVPVRDDLWAGGVIQQNTSLTSSTYRVTIQVVSHLLLQS